MEIITNEIFRALGYLFVAFIVWNAYNMACNKAKGGNFKIVLLKGFLWCGGIALFASMTLGNVMCEQSIYPNGGCEQYSDGGYIPTTEQRTAKFAYLMTLLFVPVVFGAIKGKDERK
ncbi:MAG: hypothetical protein WCT18_04690 [Patescibacteria group bacterium]